MNMFNNILSVSIENLVGLECLRLNTNWQEKDIFNKLLCDFIFTLLSLIPIL